MKKYAILMIITFLNLILLKGQGKALSYQSKIADLGEIQIEYMDFGGKGIPMIWVQDFHNYFEGPYTDSILISYISKLSKYTRVIAPLKRGYGKSTDTEWGYDVATLAEDLVSFMDALGIKKAILLGRLPANQEMTWIAEHHPEKLAGLVYWGNPILIAGCNNEDELLLIENWSALAPDFEKEKEKRMVMSRAFWRPHFLSDPHQRINVPTLRIINPKFDSSSVFRRLTEPGMLAKSIEGDIAGYEEELANLRTLVGDSTRFSRLCDHLIKCDPTNRLDQGMERAFGKHLKTIENHTLMNSEEDYIRYLEWFIEQVSSFIKMKIK